MGFYVLTLRYLTNVFLMMKKIYLLCIALILIVTSCNKDDNPIIITDYQNELQQLLDDGWAQFTEGKENFPGGYALQILSPVGDFFVGAGELKNIASNIHFRAGSTTKMFTAAAIVLLHQQEKLNINHFVTDLIPGTSEPYLPATEEFNIPFKDRITIKMLLQHRAGMFDLINQDVPASMPQPYAGKRYCDYIIEDLEQPNHTFTITEMANIVAVNQLYNSAPEEMFHYSDTGMGLLGLIIERVSGLRYDQFIKENLLTPNDLADTSFPFSGDDITLPSLFADSYLYSQGQQMTVTEYNVSRNVAEGNIITTPEDLSVWVKKLYTGEAGIEFKNVQYMMMDCLPTFESHQNYGLGTVYTPTMGYGHNGGIWGYFTSARYDPDTDITYVIFTNVWDYDMLIFDVTAQLFNLYALVYEAKEILQQ